MKAKKLKPMCTVITMPAIDYSCMRMTGQPDSPYNYFTIGSPTTRSSSYLQEANETDAENNITKDLKNLILSSPDKTDSLTATKRVKFADAVGKDLVEIRIMTAGRDTPPNLDPSILNIFCDSHYVKPVGPSFTLHFQQPVSDYCQFRQRLEKNKVSLESLSVNDNRLLGTIKVKNLAFHKNVFVRLTLDNWRSHEDVQAYYVNNGIVSPQGSRIPSAIDTFSFDYEIPCNRLTDFPLAFAVCFQCDGTEFWDNNDTKNYIISVSNPNMVMRPPYARRDSCDLFPGDTNWTEFAVWKSLDDDLTPYW